MAMSEQEFFMTRPRPRIEFADLGTGQLVVLWKKLFDIPPPHSAKREMLARLITYASQERAYGSLPRATRKSLDWFRAADRQASPTPADGPSLRLGARLIRSWNGVSHEVTVLDRGFAYRGKHYRSLSEVAETITGAHWSGPRFFGLKKPRSKPDERASA